MVNKKGIITATQEISTIHTGTWMQMDKVTHAPLLK